MILDDNRDISIKKYKILESAYPSKKSILITLCIFIVLFIITFLLGNIVKSTLLGCLILFILIKYLFMEENWETSILFDGKEISISKPYSTTKHLCSTCKIQENDKWFIMKIVYIPIPRFLLSMPFPFEYHTSIVANKTNVFPSYESFIKELELRKNK